MKKLIQQGIKTEIIYTGNFSKKFKRANKIKASYAIILGEEEVQQKLLKFKDLKSGREDLIDLEHAIKKIKNK